MRNSNTYFKVIYEKGTEGKYPTYQEALDYVLLYIKGDMLRGKPSISMVTSVQVCSYEDLVEAKK